MHSFSIGKTHRRNQTTPPPRKNWELDDLIISEPETEVEKRAELIKHLNHPFYPSDETLCILASKVYQDKITDLPSGWTIIATENNQNDGYDGAAFFHKECHQLVIAHRGTVPTHLKDLWADFKGVLRNNDTSQIISACNFALQVLKKFGNAFSSISITGHSLGAWLAQITTFAVEYLTDDGENFRRLKPEERKYHPHTVTFDSPGCKEMLCKMLRQYGKEPDLSIMELDINTYFIAPNRINCQNSHVGKLIRFVSQLNSNFLTHTIDFHKMKKFLKAFEKSDRKEEVSIWPKTDGVRKTLQQELRISKAGEYKKFFKEGTSSNNFNPDRDTLSQLNEKKMEIHYDAEEFRESVMKMNIFTESERIFLKSWKILKENKINPSKLNEFLKDLGSFDSFLSNFDVSDDKIECVSEGDLVDIVKKTKWLFLYLPHASEIMKKQISDTPLIFEAMYGTATNGYIQNFPNYGITYKDTIGLIEFLENKKDRILLIKTKNTKDETFRLYNILEQNEKLRGKFSLFSFKDVNYIDKFVDVCSVLASKSIIDNVLIIDFENSENFEVVTKLCEKTLNSDDLDDLQKKIVVVAQKSDLSNDQFITKVIKEPSLMDLADDSLQDIMDQEIVSLGDERLSLSDFLKTNNLKTLSNLIPFHLLKKKFFETSEMEELDFENDHFKKVFLTLTSGKALKNITMSHFENLITNYEYEDVKFLITGANENAILTRLQDEYENQIVLHSTTDQDCSLEIFTTLCLKNPDIKVFRLHLSDPDDNFLTWLDVFDYDLYIKRKFIVGDTEVNEEELIERKEKFTLISNDPGMGKSATLMHLAKKIYHGWVFWINLIDAHKFIDFNSVNMDTVVAFLLKFSNTVSDLATILLKYSLKNGDSIPVYLFFDGVDEIQDSERKKRTAIIDQITGILEFLNKETCAKLFISSRTYFCKQLEEKFHTEAIRLKEVSKQEQIDFCTKLWTSKLSLVVSNDYQLEELKSYAKNLLDNINASIDKKTLSFLGIPLQLKMISEIFQPDRPENIIFEEFNCNLHELYSKFEDKKYDIYKKEKTIFVHSAIMKGALDNFKNAHRILGIKHLLPDFQTEQTEQIEPEILTYLNRIGLVQVNDNAISFIHQTFAEYFAAERIAKLTEKSTEMEKKFVAYEILTENNYNMIRRFMNDIFEKSENNHEVLNFLPQIWKERYISLGYFQLHAGWVEIFFDNLVRENNSKLIELVLKNLSRFDEALKDELLLVRSEFKETILYKAILYSNTNTALKVLNHWPDVNIKTEDGETFLHLSAKKPSFNSFSLQLLQNGSDANLKSEKGVNFIDIACEHQNWNLLLEVYKLNENYDCLTGKLKIIFYQAVETNQIDLALKLLDEMVDFNYSDQAPPSLEYGGWNLIRAVIDWEKMPRDLESAKKILAMKKEISGFGFENDLNYTNEKNQTFLHFAVGLDNIDLVKILIENGADVTYPDESNVSPLAVAAKKQNWRIFSFLIKQQKNQLTVNAGLLCVCQYKNSDFALELIEEGADINFPDKDGNTPILLAAKHGNWDLVSELLHLNIDAKILNNENRSLWHYSILAGKLDLALYLIEKHEIDVNSTDDRGNTTILLAAKNQKWDLVLRLIELKASLTHCNEDGESLLYLACKVKNFDLALDLIKNYEVDVSSADTWTNTLILPVAKNKMWNLVLKLIKPNVSATQTDKGEHLIHLACKDGQLELVSDLIRKHGVDVNVATFSNNTPVLLAAKYGKWDLVLKLIELKALVTHANKSQESLLHFACRDNKLQLALELVTKYRMDVNHRDGRGKTSLWHAAEQKNYDLVTKLINLNADPKIPDKNGKTVLHYACKNNQTDLVLFLIEKGCNVHALDRNKISPYDVLTRHGYTDLKNLIDGKQCA